MLSQYLIPQHSFSRLMGKLANSQFKPLKNWMIDTFIKRYKVNMDEAIVADPQAYVSFNDFFTRKLRAETRPIVQDEHIIVSPVDGVISQLGAIKQGRIFQAKGREYNVTELLANNVEQSEVFAKGQFITLYLAPKDYHRVHMPIAAELKQMIYVPGKLFSVQPRTVESIPNLFARNERVIAIFDTVYGPMAIILVAAVIVGSVDIAWHGSVAPGTKRIQQWHYPNANIRHTHLAKGDEVGYFNLGSTVIVLFANSQLQWGKGIEPGVNVKFGQGLGSIYNSTILGVNH